MTWSLYPGTTRIKVIFRSGSNQRSSLLTIGYGNAWVNCRFFNHARTDSSQLRNPVDDESGLVYDYKDSKFMKYSEWIVTLLTTTIASLMPALVILWLVHVEKTVTRIWITIGFTGGTGLLMKTITNASMKEILTATIA